MAVNINRENPDQFYRYKMPLILAKVNLRSYISQWSMHDKLEVMVVQFLSASSMVMICNE